MGFQQQQRPIKIREVWKENLETEMALIRKAISTRHVYVSIDTEFPGIIISPEIKTPHINPSDTYRHMKQNVDALQLVQLGLTLSDAHGNLPGDAAHRHVWQFNFRDFDIDRDPQNPDSIALLKRQGIDFKMNREKGIDSREFAMCFLKSGLIFNASLKWVTFHGAYDFGFLVKLLIQQEQEQFLEFRLLARPKLPPKLPDDLAKFVFTLEYYFGGGLFDVKRMIQECPGFYGGLERVATDLGVVRSVGKSHQAGSDAMLAMLTFFRLRDLYFGQNDYQLQRFRGLLYGLEPHKNGPVIFMVSNPIKMVCCHLY